MLSCFGDEGVQEAILLGLRERGVDVGWVQERGFQGLSDPEVAALALSEHRVLLATDPDFLDLLGRAALQGAPFPPLSLLAATAPIHRNRRESRKLAGRS